MVHEVQAAERTPNRHLVGGVKGDTERAAHCWILLVPAKAHTNVNGHLYVFCGHIIYNKRGLHCDLAIFGLLLFMRIRGGR